MNIFYSKASIKIYNVLFLTMDISNLSYKQQLYKINMLRCILGLLHLRKRPNEAIWEMRINGRWIRHTSIVLVE